MLYYEKEGKQLSCLIIRATTACFDILATIMVLGISPRFDVEGTSSGVIPKSTCSMVESHILWLSLFPSVWVESFTLAVLQVCRSFESSGTDPSSISTVFQTATHELLKSSSQPFFKHCCFETIRRSARS